MNEYLFGFFFAFTFNLFYNAPSLLATPIIGGDKDSGNQFKYHVSIHVIDKTTNKYGAICGGSIVHASYILTAATCFMDKEYGVIKYALNLAEEKPKILAGTNQLNGRGTEIHIARVFVPENFDVTDFPEVDIALAKLKSNIIVGREVEIAHLGYLYPNSELGQTATFCGFGYFELKKNEHEISGPVEAESPIIRFLSITMMGKVDCPGYTFLICGRNIHSVDIKTSCHGDGGAGLLYDNSIVGVLSYGPKNCDTNKYPIGFTRLWTFRKFIESVLEERIDHSTVYVMDEHSVPHGGYSHLEWTPRKGVLPPRAPREPPKWGLNKFLGFGRSHHYGLSA